MVDEGCMYPSSFRVMHSGMESQDAYNSATSFASNAKVMVHQEMVDKARMVPLLNAALFSLVRKQCPAALLLEFFSEKYNSLEYFARIMSLARQHSITFGYAAK
eukprot:3850677-Ditylum_brightwellii.AAC.1